MKITIGVFAHVDAGKTTFCESLLYQTNSIKMLGRVDHGSAVMDHHELEQRRGITIFSDIASLSHRGIDYYLIDTPGHSDFSAEMERSLMILDAAILLISASDGVQSHTITVFRLLAKRHIPVYIFINKTDLAGTIVKACIADIKAKLNIDTYLIDNLADIYSEEFMLELCEHDDDLMNAYLESALDKLAVQKAVKRQISRGSIALAVAGSALKQKGVLETLELLGETIALDGVYSPLTETERFCPLRSNSQAGFAARVFKVIYDPKGMRVTFIKCLCGSLKIRQEIAYGQGLYEKVHEIRDYQGKSYKNVGAVNKGDVVGITGLTQAIPGMGLGVCGDLPAPKLRSALKAALILNDNPFNEVMECLRKLEAQDPLLEVNYEPSVKEISVHIMGMIQLEVLKELIVGQFGFVVDFAACSIIYRETIEEKVMGYGHFEPLRHYAEVHLQLEPNPQGGLEFSSKLHQDNLPKQYQNLIRHYILDIEHQGVLTGSSLTDIRFVLVAGAIHLEHTAGGDLREAVCRCIRQGLEKANSVLLEPYYEFFIDVDIVYVGRVLADIIKLQGVFEPVQNIGERAHISGKGPVVTFLDYQAKLLSFTKGSGAVSYRFLGYFPCHDPAKVIEKINYQKERDTKNTSSSVFCAKGAGFEVKWYEAEKYMHLL
ncbi:MAG: TetM/TetW/TetO/TetS family tetracycline resistance ribosomal protection protein [Firmicutes bacterium]|nr:TetM/TetW/TetO/TetS family tetracycline resistance ribosomal protection protein [Bacillota bacterium]